MRCLFTSILSLAGLATVVANQPQLPINQTSPTNRATQCPKFFNTAPSSNAGTGGPNFGPLLDSVHFQVSFRYMKWGRNTWLQERFYSNVQDLPIKNLRFCITPTNWGPTADTKYAPSFQNRIKFSPRIKGAQPQWFALPDAENTYLSSTTLAKPGVKTYCTIVPEVKPKGFQKVYWLYDSNACATNATITGWMSFDNPWAGSAYPSTPAYCDSARTTNTTNAQNTIRNYNTWNLKIADSCGTCTLGVNCKNNKGAPKAPKPPKAPKF